MGGLIGLNNGLIENSFSEADVIGTAQEYDYVGGICGRNEGNIEQCYNVGVVKGDNYVGSIVGSVSYYGVCKNCYYLSGTADEGGDGDNTKLLTAAQMKLADSFTGFDFNKVWEIDVNGTYKYPQLKNARIDRISGFELIKAPDKTVYNQGDKLDVFGGAVKITYQDSVATPVEVLLTENMIDLTSFDMRKVGTQNVKITFGGYNVSYPIEVKAIPVTSVSFNNGAINIDKGNSKVIAAKVLPENATYNKLTYESSAPQIVSVDSNTGKITAISRGDAIITATSPEGVSASYKVVVKVPATNIVLNVKSLDMKKGDFNTVKAALSPIDSTDVIAWSSSDSRIASVDSTGKIVANGAGKVNIVAKANNAMSKVITVTVTQDIQEFTITGLVDQYYTGKGIEQEIQISDGAKVLKEGTDYTVEYSDNVEEGTATVIVSGKGYYDGSIISSFKIKKRVYTVQFISDGKVVYTQNVKEGQSAKAPKVSKKGYAFSAWSKSYKNVYSNITTVAKWSKISVGTSTLKSTKNVGKGKVKVTFKSVSKAEGYEIRYSLKSNMAKAKVVYCKGNNATIKQLSEGKNYFIQVRAYVLDSAGEKVYGAKSKTKSHNTFYYSEPKGSYKMNFAGYGIKSMYTKKGALYIVNDGTEEVFEVGKNCVPLIKKKVAYKLSSKCKWIVSTVVYDEDNNCTVEKRKVKFKEFIKLIKEQRKMYLIGDGRLSPYWSEIIVKNGKITTIQFNTTSYSTLDD